MSGINEQVINAEIYQIGPQGIPGEAATISVGTVTTGAAGTDASVANSGTSSAAVLDFVIPQGAQGLQGIQGPQGIQGLTGATGNGISSIEKTGTVGLVDTYRITFTDNTYFDFDVTNGSSISDIEKTGTSGLVDTYTITLTNGDTHTFTVTNGAQGEKGETGEVGNGVLGVTKMSTTGLVDNYRMTFTNGTYFDFDVANAKSITGISKTGTSGLTDTYTITFNDNTSTAYNIVNGRGVTNVALLSWEGLVKTYRMTFNDGTYFDYEVTNGAGGQTEWGGIAGVLSNQTDLQTALNDKMNNTQSHALKSYSDNGELLTDAEGLADVTNYAHSTFDLSKFTVVGSPNITDDGLLSNTSQTNYVKKVLTNQSWNNFEITFNNIQCTTTSAIQVFFDLYGAGNQRINVRKNANGQIQLAIVNVSLVKLFDEASTISGKVGFDGTKYYWTINGVSDNFASTTALTQEDYTIYFGCFYDLTGGGLTNGSIDLKQFSITVDGVPIFSGNKTGIDTIKPDNYTVVGTPTISADGILSNTSSTNYLAKDLSILNGKTDIVFYTPIATILSAPSGNVGLWGNTRRSGEFQIESWLQSNGNVYTVIYKGNQTADQIMRVHSDNLVGHTIQYKITYKSNEWAIYHSIDGGEFTQNGLTVSIGTNPATDSTSILFNSSYPWGIGVDSSTGGEPLSTYGSIDLNAFKIYVDDNLIYQPCLKIPYTLSKTGSKVVNYIYRPRVNDMAEQFGYANYYTLSDTDFTLPQVELYGLIGDKTLRESYYNGVTYWELFSNRRLEQGGTCESGVEYTLPKPFADANYVLTIPYTSKTATSFIPSATGDFIAKGTGLL